MAPSIRAASHAGSWYSASSSKLDKELDGWLAKVQCPSASPLQGTSGLLETPVKNCRAIIAPHAGYSYSGPAAAWAYRCIHKTAIERVFVLGPSHHAYLDGCALTKCDDYETPVGNLPIDKDTVKELEATGKFSKMSQQVDEDEHSIEMHLPYIRKVFEGCDIRIVPVLVGAINTTKEKSFGQLLAPYLADPKTLFVVSTDFCHWGTRFSYTYYKSPSDTHSSSLSPSKLPPSLSSYPIHDSIIDLDLAGMSHIAIQRGTDKTASAAHASFSDYLKSTRNTICGRHPIGVLLGAVAELQNRHESGWSTEEVTLAWTRYEHSSECKSISDSSVSYASAYLQSGAL